MNIYIFCWEKIGQHIVAGFIRVTQGFTETVFKEIITWIKPITNQAFFNQLENTVLTKYLKITLTKFDLILDDLTHI